MWNMWSATGELLREKEREILHLKEEREDLLSLLDFLEREKIGDRRSETKDQTGDQTEAQTKDQTSGRRTSEIRGRDQDKGQQQRGLILQKK